MKNYVTYFNELSVTDKIITVLGLIVAVNFATFLLGVAVCLLQGVFKFVVIALIIGAVCYGVKSLKDKYFVK